MPPTITRERLLVALAQFDAELRATAPWADWTNNAAHRWAIAHGGRRYPVKQIARQGFTIAWLDRPGPQPPAARAREDCTAATDRLRGRVAELELRLLAEQVRCRLALAVNAELAEHAPACPIVQCCGYTVAEQAAATAIALCDGEPPTYEALAVALAEAAR